MGKLNWTIKACSIFLLWATTAIALPAQTLTTLYSFDGTDGALPTLVRAANGNFYGTTSAGGTNNLGTVFKITPDGVLTTLYSFCSQSACTDGDYPSPFASLVQGTDGNFYGTTEAGGAFANCPNAAGCGTVFKITPSGTLTTLYRFCSESDCTDGQEPLANLIQGTDGVFYGTTYFGGAYIGCNDVTGCGTIFKITSSGVLTTVFSFDNLDGGFPFGGLVQVANGDFYGTTEFGGAYMYGTVFKITPSGKLTTLHSFDLTDGDMVDAGLTQGADGNFYGTTFKGGGNTCDYGVGCGTVFKITPRGTLTTLHNFTGPLTDGEWPRGALVLGTDGNLYGTTELGGSGGIGSGSGGTVFKITPAGILTTVYSFCSQSDCTDGLGPVAALFQDVNGRFYGTTAYGGAYTSCNAGQGCGTLFNLSVGLSPFVKTQPTSGIVGMMVSILGTNLTGATKVTFHGVAAEFTVVSSSLVTTTVPTGATTGAVKVVTPGGTLSSNEPFQVLP